MARVDVVMPQMGESIAEGTLSRWLKKVGDAVMRDEPIFEISTDKVDAEIPSPISGVLAEIVIGEGVTVAVETIVARIETEQGASLAPAPATQAPMSAAPPVPSRAAEPVASRAATPVPSRAATPVAPPSSPSSIVHRPSSDSFESRIRTRSSPLVRRMAAEHGVEIAALAGSGIAGRVTR